MTIMDAVKLGDVLRRARLDAGLDQKELANKIGVSGGAISKWELGYSEPTVTQLRKIAEATDADWLYDLRELPSRCTPVLAGQAA